MKLLRLWLLVLLAALLPVRGALAAAMLCPPAVSSDNHALVEMAAEMAAHHGHDMAQHQDHGPSHGHSNHQAMPDTGTAPHHHDGAAQDKCSLCAACCSMLPLLSGFADLPQPFDAVERFPELAVPAPSFVSDGQERPPRST